MTVRFPPGSGLPVSSSAARSIHRRRTPTSANTPARSPAAATQHGRGLPGRSGNGMAWQQVQVQHSGSSRCSSKRGGSGVLGSPLPQGLPAQLVTPIWTSCPAVGPSTMRGPPESPPHTPDRLGGCRPGRGTPRRTGLESVRRRQQRVEARQVKQTRQQRRSSAAAAPVQHDSREQHSMALDRKRITILCTSQKPSSKVVAPTCRWHSLSGSTRVRSCVGGKGEH